MGGGFLSQMAFDANELGAILRADFFYIIRILFKRNKASHLRGAYYI